MVSATAAHLDLAQRCAASRWSQSAEGICTVYALGEAISGFCRELDRLELVQDCRSHLANLAAASRGMAYAAAVRDETAFQAWVARAQRIHETLATALGIPMPPPPAPRELSARDALEEIAATIDQWSHLADGPASPATIRGIAARIIPTAYAALGGVTETEHALIRLICEAWGVVVGIPASARPLEHVRADWVALCHEWRDYGEGPSPGVIDLQAYVAVTCERAAALMNHIQESRTHGNDNTGRDLRLCLALAERARDAISSPVLMRGNVRFWSRARVLAGSWVGGLQTTLDGLRGGSREDTLSGWTAAHAARRQLESAARQALEARGVA